MISMKKMIWLLSILLIIFSLGMIILLGASGHSIYFNNFETLKYLGLIILYLSTSVFLIVYIYKKSSKIKKITKTLLLLVFISFLYLFYEIFKVKIGDYFALIPIVILLGMIILNIKIFFFLLKEQKINLQ